MSYYTHHDLSSLSAAVGIPDPLLCEGSAILTAPGSRRSVGRLLRWELGVTRALVVCPVGLMKLGDEVLEGVRRAGVDCAPLVAVLDGEACKQGTGELARLWEVFAASGLDRRSVVVAVGGGTLTDLVGFAASTFVRGLRWVAVPTTLLGMVDAAVGGKTGIDLCGRKNLVGTFHQPIAVFQDVEALETLPARERLCGLAEVVKHGLLDERLWERLEKGVAVDSAFVRAAAQVKVRWVNADPRETAPDFPSREDLNLGHTVAHAVEAASGYRVPHGFAVALGLLVEADLAERLGVAGKGLRDRLATVLERWGFDGWDLAVEVGHLTDQTKILLALADDKKRRGRAVRFVLPTGRPDRPTSVREIDVDEVCNVVAPSLELALAGGPDRRAAPDA